MIQSCGVSVMLGLLCFYTGFMMGSTTSFTSGGGSHISEAEIQRRIQEEVQKATAKVKSESSAVQDDPKVLRCARAISHGA